MTQYVTYDKVNKILFVDYTDLTITSQIMKQILTETQAWSAKLNGKVYYLACMQNAQTTEEVQQNWGNFTKELLQYVKGVVRYQATDLMTNITIRTNTVLYHSQGANSHIYPNR